MAELHVVSLEYHESDLRKWHERHHEMLMDSQASPFIKEILRHKLKVRPNRFFGEAYVASRVAHEEGWYNSYEWLTSDVWTDRSNDGDEFHVEFKRALRKYFPRLAELQVRARAFAHVLGKNPMPPDLWLIVNGEHRFIEVKLPDDSLGPHQIAGLALLSEYLPSERPVSVWVYNLASTVTQFKECLDQLSR